MCDDSTDDMATKRAAWEAAVNASKFPSGPTLRELLITNESEARCSVAIDVGARESPCEPMPHSADSMRFNLFVPRDAALLPEMELVVTLRNQQGHFALDRVPLAVLPRIDNAVDLRAYLPEIVRMFNCVEVLVQVVVATDATTDATTDAPLGTLFVDYVFYTGPKREAIHGIIQQNGPSKLTVHFLLRAMQTPAPPLYTLRRISDPKQVWLFMRNTWTFYIHVHPSALRPSTLTVYHEDQWRTTLPIQLLERINSDTYVITLPRNPEPKYIQLHTDTPTTIYQRDTHE